MKALGMICGIGSMLIGAKRQGYDIIGNIEWRSGYWTGTFEHNFPGAFMAKDLKSLTPEQLEQCKGVDYMTGHTECGNFSSLNVLPKAGDPGVFSDIPLFAEAVRVLGPKVFSMDNLPASLLQFGPDWWAEQCPGYDIDFEWVSNYNYGNPQKNRKRLFVIGAKSDLGFYFIPGEKPGELTDSVGQRLRGLAPDAPNHCIFGDDDIVDSWYTYQVDPSTPPEDKSKLTVRELREYSAGYRPGQTLKAYNRKGVLITKLGRAKMADSGSCHVLTARNNSLKEDATPLTVRERARLQGVPDNFIFLQGSETPAKGGKLIIQTGKCMPVEFTSYLSAYVKWFLEGNRPEDFPQATFERYIKPNQHIDRAKQEWCAVYGYACHQVCRFCGSSKGCPNV